MATDGCYMLLSIFYYVVTPHDDDSSSFTEPFFVRLLPHCSCLPLLIRPRRRTGARVLPSITVLIPLHGWGSEMNKLLACRISGQAFRDNNEKTAFHLDKHRDCLHAEGGEDEQVNCYHRGEKASSKQASTCKVGWTKNRLKETGRLAINCTSCTRVSSVGWGVVGQRTFHARLSYGNFLLSRSPRWTIKNWFLDNGFLMGPLLSFVKSRLE